MGSALLGQNKIWSTLSTFIYNNEECVIWLTLDHFHWKLIPLFIVYKLKGMNHCQIHNLYIKLFKEISLVWVRTIVVYFVPFRPERTENLVPVCKPVRDTSHFTSGKISGCFDRKVYFGQITFLVFIFIFFSTLLLLPSSFYFLLSSSSFFFPPNSLSLYLFFTIFFLVEVQAFTWCY